MFAAFYARVYTEGESGFAYYEYTDISQQSDFEAYLAQVSGVALYDTGVEAQYGDQLITLSTCTNRSRDERFVWLADKSSIKTADGESHRELDIVFHIFP